MHAIPPAPMPAMAMSRDAASAKTVEAATENAPPALGVSTAETGFATEFVVAQPITVPTNGQRVSLSLSEHQLNAQVRVRTTPMQEAAAYLVATVADPLPGVWPGGSISLYRDGAYVGNAMLMPNLLPTSGLAFGRDELVNVRVHAPERHSASGGLLSARNERRDTHRFSIENRHKNSIQLQVLDAAPVSQHAQVQVQSRYQPEPATTRWNQQPGHIEWQHTLPAGASQDFEAEHRISWPEDAQLRER